MPAVSKMVEFGDQIQILFDDGSHELAYPMGEVWQSVRVQLQRMGNQLTVIYGGGNKALAVPSVGGVWFVGPSTGTPPDPSNLIDYFTPYWPLTGTWEDHASYSHGGTDWGMAFGAPIRAPAAGTLVNYGDTDAAGLKSMLNLDVSHPRKLPASGTVMNGDYVENPTAGAVAFMIQHLSSQVAEGHYAQGQDIGYVGNTAGPGNTGDTHLHAHLLAGNFINADRLDFMKFL